MNKLTLSIIIPVYNESENILETFNEIKRHVHVIHEIIVVYDFDQDTTVPVVKKAQKQMHNIYLVKNSVCRGPSGAIRTGIKRAKAPLILVTMADLCDDLSQVKELLRLVPDKAAIACPSRYCKGGEQQLKQSPKVWIPKTAGFLIKLLTGIPTYDPTNSFKLYAKEMLDKLTLQSTVSFSVTLEIVVKAHALGYNIIEIPTVWRDRQHGKTNFKLWRSVMSYSPWFFYALFHRKNTVKN